MPCIIPPNLLEHLLNYLFSNLVTGVVRCGCRGEWESTKILKYKLLWHRDKTTMQMKNLDVEGARQEGNEAILTSIRLLPKLMISHCFQLGKNISVSFSRSKISEKIRCFQTIWKTLVRRSSLLVFLSYADLSRIQHQNMYCSGKLFLTIFFSSVG